MGALTVLTAVCGGRDVVKAQPPLEADFICFTDQPEVPEPWTRIDIRADLGSLRMNAKQYKILAHKWVFTEYSLWIDGSVELLPSLDIDWLLSCVKGADLAVFEHRLSDIGCIYREALLVMQSFKEDPETVWPWIRQLREEGYPANNGLHETTVILRRHTPEMNAFCEEWWRLVNMHSSRDQLTFDYLLWKTGFPYAEFEGTVPESGWTKSHPHAR